MQFDMMVLSAAAIIRGRDSRISVECQVGIRYAEQALEGSSLLYTHDDDQMCAIAPPPPPLFLRCEIHRRMYTRRATDDEMLGRRK